MLFRSEDGGGPLALSDDSNLIGVVSRWNIVIAIGYV
jgi:hypothetical protein